MIPNLKSSPYFFCCFLKHPIPKLLTIELTIELTINYS